MTKRKWLIVTIAVVVAGLFVVFGLNRDTQAQYFTAKVERGDIHDVVEATGTINSVITVQVGSQVSGSIAKLMPISTLAYIGETLLPSSIQPCSKGLCCKQPLI
jgi:hypothetical protein